MQQAVTKVELADFAKRFWEVVSPYKVFAFHGEMGAGKTTIISALCKACGVIDSVSSPTFSIINEYSFERNGSTQVIYHIDLYRLENEEEIDRTGVEECLFSGAICLVEWPEKASWLFDEKTVHVTVDVVEDDKRLIKLDLPSSSVREQL